MADQILIKISQDIGEIKGEMRGMRSDTKEVKEQLIKMNGRVDSLESENDKRKGVITVIGAIAGIAASFIWNIISKKIFGK